MVKTEIVRLHFDPNHAKKLLSGSGVCQLHSDYLTGKRGTALEVEVPKAVATKLRKAVRSKKSARVRMDDLGGEGIREWFQNLGRQIKKGYEKIKPSVAPLVKEGVGKLVDMGSSAVAPFLPQQVNQLIQDNKGKAVDQLGQLTGAYGVQLPMMGIPYGMPIYGGAMNPAVFYPQVYSNWSTQSMPLAPAMQSKNPYPGWGYPAHFAETSGGSFKAI